MAENELRMCSVRTRARGCKAEGWCSDLLNYPANHLSVPLNGQLCATIYHTHQSSHVLILGYILLADPAPACEISPHIPL